jgi:hypothetical protein
MSETAYFGYLGFAVAVASLLASIYFFVRTTKLQRQLAEAQGVFRRTRVGVRFFSDDNETTYDNTYYLFALPLGRAKTLVLPFHYVLCNTGDASAEDVTLFVRMSKDLHFCGHVRANHTSGLPRPTMFLVSDTDHTHTHALNLERLNPGEAISINDLLSISMETIFKHHMSLKSKDDQRVQVTSWIEFSWVLDFTIMQKDHMPLSRRIEIGVIDITTKTALECIEEYNAILEKRAARRRAGLPWWKRIMPEQNGRSVRRFLFYEFAGTLEPFEGRKDILEIKGKLTQAHGLRLPDKLWVPALNVRATKAAPAQRADT